jgi:triacylglycerol lipase
MEYYDHFQGIVQTESYDEKTALKKENKNNSVDSWFMQRVGALTKFIDSTASRLDAGNNHLLSADEESYIPRLIKDL